MQPNYYAKHWNEWPLPVVPVHDKLNPFKDDRVDLSIAIAYNLPYENIKFITVYGLLSGAKESGVLNGVDTLVEATSGNTGVVLSSLAKSFGDLKVKLVVMPDLPEGKRFPLIMAGAEVIPPETGLSTIATARKLGGGGWKDKGWKAENGTLNLDQYTNMDGAKLHTDFTGPKIAGQLPYPATVFVTGVGTGGTLVGTSRFFRGKNKNIKIVGVLCAPGQEIPGVRDLNRMKEVNLPWKESLDEAIEIPTRPSYLASLWFNWLMGLTPGPSSGFAYLGAIKFLKQHKAAGTLDSLRDEKGRIHAVILFPDGNRPYGDRFMANLPFDYMSQPTAPLPWDFPGNDL